MLDLPDGTVLFSSTYNGLYVYQPGGSPLPSGKPTITRVRSNGDGSYHLVGTGFNGISEGASYGDDKQMNSNYPLVRVTDALSGNVFYARTYDWSSDQRPDGIDVRHDRVPAAELFAARAVLVRGRCQWVQLGSLCSGTVDQCDVLRRRNGSVLSLLQQRRHVARLREFCDDRRRSARSSG
jgi:hypothetical protein